MKFLYKVILLFSYFSKILSIFINNSFELSLFDESIRFIIFFINIFLSFNKIWVITFLFSKILIKSSLGNDSLLRINILTNASIIFLIINSEEFSPSLSIFTKSHIAIFIICLLIYLLLYFIIGINL